MVAARRRPARRPLALALVLMALAALATTALAADAPVRRQQQRRERRRQQQQQQQLERRDGDAKYFHEPWGSLALVHYDARFYTQEVPYDEHRAVLGDLIRSYLSVMDGAGAETWLAHGTLLGWWWNGEVMPWDYDLDVQVTGATLQWMGERLNRTEHAYNSTAGGAQKHYMLDVNPHHAEDRGDGLNIIDARWIDTANGMFVDITGVREREPADSPGVWSCKNAHRYETLELWPLRVSEFEGVRARVPRAVDKILTDEYGAKCLVADEYEGHRWDRAVKAWVPMDEPARTAARDEVRERKRLDLARQGRLSAAGP